ncbi:phage baseplate upper protein [Staphylococcus coagulans]|uniref:Phage baseplate upper protein n=2 Tax=Staphylococcus coagulans TaxID=74706 RepID=A0ABU1EVE1_9STAP|nr:phage baseplate upper protein [Staphylococcus coagulans]MDR5602076.1 phage baseplate upper protein [Staphylococcus coagulans]
MDNFSKDDNKLELEVTSKYGRIINTDIRFFASDKGTSVLNFLITKNNVPLAISDNHAKASIVLKSENYSVDSGAYISDDLTIVDPINGLLQYVIPSKFLKYNGKVNAQVFFTQNGSGNVVVEREFTFQIDNDLISDFDGETKLTYIKSIQDVIESVGDEVTTLKKSLESAKSVVSSIESESSKSIQQIEVKKNESVEAITITQKAAIEQLDSKLAEVVLHKKEIEQKIDFYTSKVDDDDLVKNTTTSNWQKYKITDDDGTVKNLSDVSIYQTLNDSNACRLVHIENATDAPSVYNNSGLLTVYVNKNNSGRAIWQPDNTNDYYTSLKSSGIWLRFEKLSDESVSKQFVENLSRSTLEQAQSYYDEHIDKKEWQKHPITNEQGYIKNVSLANSDDSFFSLGTGFYYVTNVPKLPSEINSSDGYLNVYAKDSLNMLYDFTPNNSNVSLKKRMVNGRLEEQWSSLSGNQNKKTLFDGSATGVGTSLTLTDDYTNYSLLMISGVYSGGTFTNAHLVYDASRITLSNTNLNDERAQGCAVYECQLQKDNNRTLSIKNDVYFDAVKQQGSGPNANKYTIKKIVGWK